ncbi:MAG: galactokinase [Syntrophales bacterium]
MELQALSPGNHPPMASGDQAGRIREAFRRHFGEPAIVVRSPGRVNLIGEHTDYNLGFALAGAVDRAIWLAASPRRDRFCRFLSVDLNDTLVLDLDKLSRSESHWANYPLGIYTELAADGRKVQGVDCAFGGNVPIASGMSSSAALECSLAFALNSLFGLVLDPVVLARLCQRAENRFVGVACGIMDPFASLLGRKDHLIRLDCRTHSFRYVPFKRSDVHVVLCDSQVRRTLRNSEYNVRRAQCEAGVSVLARAFPEVWSLRDATLDMLEAVRNRLDHLVYRRCRYVVEENLRVLEVCEALERNDLQAVGTLMNATHRGLRDEYEVSCAEIDVLAEAAMEVPGILGSRIMGGGFGGCTINLVEETSLDRFREAMAAVFRDRLKKSPVLHICRIDNGTTEEI